MADYVDYVDLCVKDILEKVKEINTENNDVYTLYNQDNLLQMSADIKLPALAVVYNGSQPIANTEKQGMYVELRVNLFIIVSTMCEQTTGTIAKQGTIDYTTLLGSFRASMRGVIAPSKALWEFKGEAPIEFEAKGESSKVGYLQSWATKVNYRDI